MTLGCEEGGFLYFAESYADELPYWMEGPRGPQLVVPYTLDANDMRFATPQGFNSGDQFFAYLRDRFDQFYAEGLTAPKMLPVGLHCRLVGRPGRAAALARFLDHVRAHDRVWVARRVDVARYWIRRHPPTGGHRPSRMGEALFVELFGDVFEHSPEITGAVGLHTALVAAMRALPPAGKRALLDAHPDLAGRLALAEGPTADSAGEQAGAGLDALSPGELARFGDLNARYRARFGFPFIMAVKGRTKDEVLGTFAERLGNREGAEFERALAEVERIALLRLRDRLPERRPASPHR